MHGEYQDLRLRRHGADLTGGFQTSHHRHAQVQNDQIRFQGQDLIDSFLAVFCFSTHFPFGIVLEQKFQASTHNFMIINKQNSSSHSPPSAGSRQSGIWDKQHISSCHAPPYRNSCISGLLVHFELNSLETSRPPEISPSRPPSASGRSIPQRLRSTRKDTSTGTPASRSLRGSAGRVAPRKPRDAYNPDKQKVAREHKTQLDLASSPPRH